MLYHFKVQFHSIFLCYWFYFYYYFYQLLFIEFILKKKQLRAIFLYELKLGHKAAKARNINSAFDQGIANERTMQRWFQKFRNGDENLEDKKVRGRTSAVDNDELKC